MAVDFGDDEVKMGERVDLATTADSCGEVQIGVGAGVGIEVTQRAWMTSGV